MRCHIEMQNATAIMCENDEDEEDFNQIVCTGKKSTETS